MPIYHGGHLRHGRCSEPGRLYSITVVTAGRKALFHDFFLGRILVHELHQVEELRLARTLCWVVMPDHLHWLLELGELELSGLLQRVKSRSAKALNQRLGRSGAVWQAGFHDHCLRGDEDVQAVARYIVANPLRAGLVERLSDYPLWDAIWL
ncbi:REP-associated tyrosine transposase [Pseudomonas schmalbachii]|uniref:Transposase n=1 Tax=Pseudomonas schmalbachii TaxID=2816993 RepID=A0ABS3TVG4_9PSED|nr:transposase [Pseudomonas schmalbachii]MBO3277638.1 transposase [Pseudomonas schmalbachii]